MTGVSMDGSSPKSSPMSAITPPPTFVEVYGKSIFDHNLQSRRNFNIKGLNSFDIRSMKPNGTPWDFSR